jgi:hypothetical protein
MGEKPCPETFQRKGNAIIKQENGRKHHYKASQLKSYAFSMHNNGREAPL